LLALEKEFRAQLNETGQIGTNDLPPIWRCLIADIADHGLRSKKLSVVKSIETF
jgi:hypothetical protein